MSDGMTRQQRFVAEHRDLGLCIVCNEKAGPRSRSFCEEHRVYRVMAKATRSGRASAAARNRRQRARKAAAGICVRHGCSAPSTGGVYCEGCRETNRARARAEYARRVEEGLCIYMGCPRRSWPNRVRCAEHLLALRERGRGRGRRREVSR